MSMEEIQYLLQDKYKVVQQISRNETHFQSFVVQRINSEEDKKLNGKMYVAKIQELIEVKKTHIGKDIIEKKLRSALVLQQEIQILLDVQRNIDKVGFPKAYDVYSLNQKRVLITDSRSLMLTKLIPLVIKNLNAQRYMKLCFKIIYDLLDRIQTIHRLNYIHEYLRPQSINFKRQQSQKDTLIISDYTRAHKFNEYNIKKQNYHKPYLFSIKPKGKNGYASIWTHAHITHSRRDDLQSFCYICIYLLRGGKLPWDDTQFGFDQKKDKQIFEKKLTIINSDIFDSEEPEKENTFQLLFDFVDAISSKSQLIPRGEKKSEKVPRQILQILTEVRNLNFEEQPNYQYIRKMINKAMNRLKIIEMEQEYYFPVPDQILYPKGF